jgi:threonine dehydrogenase-like Zn-dependent dehydrogenase
MDKTREEAMRAVIRRKNKLVVGEMARPEAGEGLVLCRTLACGICGSDLHALDHMDRMLRMAVLAGTEGADPNADMVFGHEFCCEVVENGPGAARGLKPGTRVVSMPVVMGAGGADSIGYSTRLPGGFAEHLVLQEALLLEVPNGLSAEHAALTEPLAVGEHAVMMGQPEKDHVHMVIGCGPVGLAVIASLKAKGLGPIVASDFSPVRRALAEKMGADRVVNPADVSPHESWKDFAVPGTRGEAMMAQMSGQPTKRPLIYECVGAPGVLQALALAVPVSSRVVVVGVCMETDQIEPLTFVTKEIELRFVLGYSPVEFAASLTSLAEGKTKYHDIITRVVSLDETPDAFVRLQTDKSEVKILVAPGRAAS